MLFSDVTPMSARTKTDHQDIAEIILVDLFLIKDEILAEQRLKTIAVKYRIK